MDAYYANLISKWLEAIKEKRYGRWCTCGFELVEHSPYSTDLASSDH